jgi:hypothetical protein
MGEGKVLWGPPVLRYSWLPQSRYSTQPTQTRIKPKTSRKAQFIGLLTTSLIWNGLTGMACYYFYENWKKGAGQGCLWLALCALCPIGLLLMIGTFKQLLILFNPTPIIHLSSFESAPGGTIDVDWVMKGRSGMIARLVFLLEGKEEVKTVEGTNTQVDQNVFTLLTVHESTVRHGIEKGQIRIQLPQEAMHSFDSGHNKIQWSLKVRGTISNWPDLEEEYEIVVRPFTRSEINT